MSAGRLSLCIAICLFIGGCASSPERGPLVFSIRSFDGSGGVSLTTKVEGSRIEVVYEDDFGHPRQTLWEGALNADQQQLLRERVATAETRWLDSGYFPSGRSGGGLQLGFEFGPEGDPNTKTTWVREVWVPTLEPLVAALDLFVPREYRIAYGVWRQATLREAVEELDEGYESDVVVSFGGELSGDAEVGRILSAPDASPRYGLFILANDTWTFGRVDTRGRVVEDLATGEVDRWGWLLNVDFDTEETKVLLSDPGAQTFGAIRAEVDLRVLPHGGPVR